MTSLILMCSLSVGAEPYPFVVMDNGRPSRRTCGLYCVYQAGLRTGKTIPFDTLFEERRLSGKHGSTVKDLEQACRDYGIAHWSLTSGGYVDLVAAGQPAIVLIKSNPTATEPDHWVVVDAQPGHARVFDPAFGSIELEQHELESLWGGPAIVIPIDTPKSAVLATWMVLKAALCLGLIGVVVLALRLTTHWKPWPALATAVVVLVLVTVISPASPIRQIEYVESRYRAYNPAEAVFIEPADALKDKDNLRFIDVRTAPQFEYRHIAKAVNVPIDDTYWQNREALAQLPSDTPLVLYCASEDCLWAETMSRSALFHRFTNVRVLHGGIASYLKAASK